MGIAIRSGTGGAPGSLSPSYNGAFTSLSALQAAHPTGTPGDFAYVGPDKYDWNPATNNWESPLLTLTADPGETIVSGAYVNGAGRQWLNDTVGSLTVPSVVTTANMIGAGFTDVTSTVGVVHQSDIANDLGTTGGGMVLGAGQGVILKAAVDAKLPLTGGTLAGPLTLAADGANPLEPVTLQQMQAASSTLASDKADKVTTISPGAGLTGGGDLSTNRTIALADTAVAPGAYTLASVTIDQQGRVTAASSGTPTAVEDLLTSTSATNALSANQGRVLTAADVASGSVAGTQLTLTLNGGGAVVIDVTTLANVPDVRLQSGAYNSATEAIDFTLTDATTISVPVAALLPVASEMSVMGDGKPTNKLRLVNDVAAPGNYKAYGTNGLGVKGWVELASASNLMPLMNGVAAPGTSGEASRADHVHQSDTSRIAVADIANDLVTNDASKVLAASQGVVLTAADIASGAVVGNNIELMLKGGTKVVIDATALLADIKLTSGVYNSTTKAIDLTLTDASVVSVPISALIPIETEMSVTGDGSTASKVKLVGDSTAPGTARYYGTDASGVKGFYDLQILMDAATTTVPMTGEYIMGWQNGIAGYFPR